MTVLSVTGQESVYDNFLRSIDENNTLLKALREEAQAQKLANRTGLTPDDPEVEFNYLWGKPSDIGRRKDFAVSQSFDFPTAYIHRNNIAKASDVSAGLKLKSERIVILLQAKQYCIELIYMNALIDEYAIRLKHAEEIALSYSARLKNGDANIIEANKAKLNYTTLLNELKTIETDRRTVLSSLQQMNGGLPIGINNSGFTETKLPLNFEDWFQEVESKNPTLQYVRSRIDIKEQEIKLNKSLWLPRLSTGYMSEQVVGEQYQGITMGVSIPLWQNRNKVRQARAEAKVAQLTLEDTKVRFYNSLHSLFLKATAMKQSNKELKDALENFNNDILLKKALDAGEISLLEYLLEMNYYYEAKNKVLENEKNLEQVLAELYAVEGF
jgi:outer membrane protein TolC